MVKIPNALGPFNERDEFFFVQHEENIRSADESADFPVPELQKQMVQVSQAISERRCANSSRVSALRRRRHIRGLERRGDGNLTAENICWQVSCSIHLFFFQSQKVSLLVLLGGCTCCK